MVARGFPFPVALISFLILMAGSAARQTDKTARPEMLWQFEAGG